MASTSTRKSGFIWPFHKTEITIQQLPLKQRRNSLPAGALLRIIGRGGSESQLRQGSLSNSAVLEPDVHYPRRQPLESEPESSSFDRPTARSRGGLGSLATRPPTPLKPSMAILDLIRGYKRRGPGSASISQNIDPDHENNENTNSYIEEIYPTGREHCQPERSLNKLTRTLGPLPSLLMGLDNRSTNFESDSIHSPITFSPPSPSAVESRPHLEQIPTSFSGIDFSSTITSATARRENLRESASSTSATTHIYVSGHSTSHFDTASLGIQVDLYPDRSDFDA